MYIDNFNKVLSLLFIFILIFISSGCSLPMTPSISKKDLILPSQIREIPLKAVVVFSKKFEDFKITDWRKGGKESDSGIMHIKVGKSSEELLKKIFPLLFEDVEFIKEGVSPKYHQILIIPEIVDAYAYLNNNEAHIEYKVSFFDSNHKLLLDVLAHGSGDNKRNLVEALGFLTVSFGTGLIAVPTLASWEHNKSFAKAEIQAMSKLIDNIMSSSVLVAYANREHDKVANLDVSFWSEIEKEYKIERFLEYLGKFDKEEYKGKYLKQAEKNIEEIKAFEKAEKEDTFEAYKKFVDEYPEGRYAPEARKVTTVEYWEKREQTSHTLCQIAQIYLDSFGSYEKTIEYYKRALEKDSNYVKAHEGLGKAYLEKGKTVKRDWNKVNQYDSLDKYLEFLEKHPNNEFTYQTKKRIEKLEWENAREIDTELAYINFLLNHPNSKFRKEAEGRIKKIKLAEELSVILVESMSKAKEIMHKLRQGMNFDNFASESSKATFVNKYFYEKDMEQELKDNVFELEFGEVSNPIKTSKGLFIVLRMDPKWESSKVVKVPGGFVQLFEFSCNKIIDANSNGIFDAGELIEVDSTIIYKGNVIAKDVAIEIWGQDENTGKILIPKHTDVTNNLLQDEKRQWLTILKVPQNIPKSKIVIKGTAGVIEGDIESIKNLVQINGNSEKLLLSEIINKASIDKCLRYLDNYSDSYFANAVKKLLSELDERLWDEVENEYKVEGFEKYLKIYSESKYKGTYYEQATKNIKEIKAFELAKTEDTYVAYRQFCKEYEDGRLTDEAKKRTTLAYWEKREQTPHVLCQQAEILLEYYNDTDRAIIKYKQALKDDSNYLVAHEGLGKSYYKMGHDHKAKEYFEKAAQSDSNNYKVFYYLGIINDKRGKSEEAIKSLTKAIELNQNCSECYNSRGRLHDITAQPNSANEDYKKVLEIEKKNGNTSSSLYRSAKESLEY